MYGGGESILGGGMSDGDIYLFIEDTLGTFSWSHTPSASNLSLISQANKVMFSFLYLQIADTTLGVATLGLEPPIILGRIDPVSWNLHQRR